MRMSGRQARAATTGEEDARHEQRRARADALDERRGDHGPERRRAQEDAVQDPEDAGKHGVRHRPLEEREAGDVHHGVREADDAEQDERPAAAVPQGGEGDRHAPERGTEAEGPTEPSPADEGDGTDRPEDAPDAERRVQRAQPGLADAEHVERQHDDEHVEGPGDERLRGEEADEDADAGIRADGLKAGHRDASESHAGLVLTGDRAAPIPATRAADQRKVAEARTKVTPGSVAASTAPPIAGPAKLMTLSIVLDATLAAVSSAGVRAREGRIAACAGRKAVATTETSPAMA